MRLCAVCSYKENMIVKTLLGNTFPLRSILYQKRLLRQKAKTKQTKIEFFRISHEGKFVPNKLQNIISLSKRLGVILFVNGGMAEPEHTKNITFSSFSMLVYEASYMKTMMIPVYGNNVIL